MNKNQVPKSLAGKLIAEANKLDVTAFSMSMPLYVLLGEAIDVARFCQHHWSAEVDPKTRALLKPGLELAGDARLARRVADEIVTLHDLLQKAHTSYLLAIVPPAEGTERAEFVLGELSAGLAWVCDDGVVDEKDAKLAALVEAHRRDADSEDALAGELADYVGLALELKEELAGIGAFDPAIIDEGGRLVLALRERSAVRARGRNGEASALLVKRNQLASLLIQRITRVRAAARYVFRHHDDIVKQVTSAYQRRRRAAARRRAGNGASAAATPATEPVEPTSLV